MLFNLTEKQLGVLKNIDYNYLLVYNQYLVVGQKTEEGEEEYLFRKNGEVINRITKNNSSKDYIIISKN